MEALKLDDVAVVDKDRCIGCAVCVGTCSPKSIKMARRR
jgi:Pyruvate/2-oxoacid:ferredoxin oxidoreductase delta subunit